jgi:hypothetical protein
MFKTKLLIILCCLLLLPVMIFPGTVFAAVDISPAQGIGGSTVTLSGLTPSQTYTIKWDGTSIVSGTVSASGTVFFYVPDDHGGVHNVLVENPTGSQVLTESFTLLPSISISPDSGTVGTDITVTGSGFGASEDGIKILYDDDAVKTGITADSDGSWTASFDAPESSLGGHDVDALGSDTTASSVDDADFDIEPSITITPTSCGVGCSVTVKGYGFEQSETGIKIVFSGTEVKTGISANSKGSWTSTFNVPAIHSGSHAVDAYGSETVSSDVTDLSFSVISGIALDKTSAYVGDVITVTGTGFAASETGIYVTLDGINQGSSVSADSKGQWATAMTVPSITHGTHTVDAHGSTTTATSIGDETLTVNAKITISPLSGNVGDRININGTGFSGSSTVVVKFGDGTVLSNISTDSTGNFSGSFDAPKGISGSVDVVATDTGNVADGATFEMDKTAPGAPLVDYPGDGDMVGFIGDTRVTFQWKDISDPSGVTYDIQVATDSAFNGVVFEHTGLTIAEYKSMADEALPNGEYYWRVRGVDEATNIGAWSATTNFKAGFMSLTTLIIIVVVLILVIVAIVRIRVVFFKKRT